MLQKVAVGRWSLDAYEGIAPGRDPARSCASTHGRSGARILHVNATPYGGGVSSCCARACRCCATSA